MLVMIDSPANPPCFELLTTLGFHRLVIHRQLVNRDAEQQQLSWIKPLGMRAVEAAENRVHLRLVPLSHRFDLLGGFTLDLIQLCFTLRDDRVTLRDNLLEQHRVIRQIEQRSRLTHDGGLSTMHCLCSASG